MKERGCQIVCGFAAADDDGVFHLTGRNPDLLQEGKDVLSGADEGKRVTAFYDEMTGRNIYFTAAFHDADDHARDDGFTELGDRTAV